MLRLEGGVWTVSSISRSRFRSRSRPGARRVSPAPAAVPVDRLVGIGFVRPRTDRPVSGVWARVDSRPFPPAFARFAGFGAAFAFRAGAFRDLAFGFFEAFLGIERRFGAADLFLVFFVFFDFFDFGGAGLRLFGEAFLRFTAFALRAAFFAIVGSSGA
jgi:hypothetical protein